MYYCTITVQDQWSEHPPAPCYIAFQCHGIKTLLADLLSLIGSTDGYAVEVLVSSFSPDDKHDFGQFSAAEKKLFDWQQDCYRQRAIEGSVPCQT